MTAKKVFGLFLTAFLKILSQPLQMGYFHIKSHISSFPGGKKKKQKIWQNLASFLARENSI